jgi:hypothetical protein
MRTRLAWLLLLAPPGACVQPLAGTGAPSDGESGESGEGGEGGDVGGGSSGATWVEVEGPVVDEVFTFEGYDLGDVDGDGRVDLVTAGTGFPPRFNVYLGQGDGVFTGAAVVTEVFDFAGFVVADVDGDGRADVLARRGSACTRAGPTGGSWRGRRRRCLRSRRCTRPISTATDGPS